MSESASVLVNFVEEFDRAVHGDDRKPALPSGDDFLIVTKDGGMQSGRAVAVVSWTCVVGGKARRAQYSIAVRHLIGCLRILEAGYTDDGMPKPGTFGRAA